MNSKIYKEWKTKNGHNAYIVNVRGSHLCGYVEIPKESPLYGLGYRDPVPGITKQWMDNIEIGKRGVIPIFIQAGNEEDTVPLDVYFDVHGSITYGSDHLLDKENSWFLGFDCNHADDYDNPKDEAYVENECESLSEQIVKYEHLNEVER